MNQELLTDLKSEKDTDGAFIDASGCCLPSTTPVDSLSFLQPDNQTAVRDQVYLVNGVLTNVEQHFQDMRALANTGAEVVGVHNSTFGLMRDLRECIGDLSRTKMSPAASTVAHLMKQSLEDSRTLHFVGHSQGAIILSRALFEVSKELKTQGLNSPQIADKLSHLRIETYGGGAARFVDGPRYVHVDNWLDPIPFNLGVGFASRLLSPCANPGKNAVQYTFFKLNNPWKRSPESRSEDKQEQLARFIDYMIHGPSDIYFPQRKSFEEMRSGSFEQDSKGFTILHK